MIRRILCLVLLASFSPAIAAAENKSHDFELYTFEDKLYSLKKVRKKPKTDTIVVDFFATYCDPCKKVIPKWQKLYEKYHDQGLQIVIVALPAHDNRDKSRKRISTYFETQEPIFPVVFDKYSLVAKKYGVVEDGNAALPQYFLLNSKGEIVSEGTEFDKIRELLSKMLE